MFEAKRSLTGVGLTAGLLLLAACADEGATAPDAQTQTAANTQQAASSEGAASTAVDGERVRMPQCTPPSEGRVSFTIGSTVLRVPSNVIENTVPTGLTGPLKREAVRADVQTRVARGEGCPATPLDAALLLVRDDLGHPLLQGNIGFVRTAQNSVTNQFSQLTTQLRDNPTGRCRPQNGDLLACPGTETKEGRETRVLYLISTDKSARMASGGPLFARCLLADQGIQGCAMFDQLGNGATYDATLNAGQYTSESLKEVQKVVAGRITAWQG